MKGGHGTSSLFLRVDPHAACGSTIRRMKNPGAGGAIFRVGAPVPRRIR